MADAWQLETSADRWLLEDGSGVWLLEAAEAVIIAGLQKIDQGVVACTAVEMGGVIQE